ncbi:MAG: DUF4921 family protein, partial [Euryarchaeota archaeon]|nr:DUF4921 family protein [Euryarchaeota archaeon]
MSYIRKHYFLDEYCIIASERSKRPSDFVSEKPERAVISNCVFCGGNEGKTPPATAVYKEGDVLEDTEDVRVTGWDVRCIPNLYPAVSPTPAKIETSDWQIDAGFGFHEVIVETPVHGRTISDLSDDELALLMQAYKDCVVHYQSKVGIEYVSLFKNWGERAGASLEHIHSQLIALPLLPPLLRREQDAIQAINKCPYCDIVDKEGNSERFVYENADVLAFTPHFSTAPFEVWILPKQHIDHFASCADKIMQSLGDAIRFVISRYDTILDSPSYNYMFYQIADGSYHLNVRIQPVLATRAGFEKNTDIYINTVSPEDAASYLR